MPNYLFLDANSSVQTAASNTVGGAQQPIVQIGSVAGTIPVSLNGSPSISGAVTVVGNPSISGTVQVSGNPSISGTVNIAGTPSISGTVNVNPVSVIGSNPSSLLTGINGQRNDGLSSFLGGNLTWNPLATDSAGRVLIKPFVSQDSTLIEFTGSIVSASTLLIQASVVGKRSYITDFWFANTGSVATVVTFKDGSTSVLGYTIAPSGSGSNSQGINIPHRTALSQDLTITPLTATSVLYVTVKGYQAP